MKCMEMFQYSICDMQLDIIKAVLISWISAGSCSSAYVFIQEVAIIVKVNIKPCSSFLSIYDPCHF